MFVSYGFNNRTQMLRIPAAGRIEDRTVDGSCNPYLAATAVLAAGLDGIENGLDPGDPTTELNLHELTEDQRKELGVELLPANLLDATRELEKDDVLRAALGKTAARGLRGLLRQDEAGRVRRSGTTRSRPGRSSATCSCSRPPQYSLADVGRERGCRTQVLRWLESR